MIDIICEPSLISRFAWKQISLRLDGWKNCDGLSSHVMSAHGANKKVTYHGNPRGLLDPYRDHRSPRHCQRGNLERNVRVRDIGSTPHPRRCSCLIKTKNCQAVRNPCNFHRRCLKLSPSSPILHPGNNLKHFLFTRMSKVFSDFQGSGHSETQTNRQLLVLQPKASKISLSLNKILLWKL